MFERQIPTYTDIAPLKGCQALGRSRTINMPLLRSEDTKHPAQASVIEEAYRTTDAPALLRRVHSMRSLPECEFCY